MRTLYYSGVLILLLVAACPRASAQNYEILDQRLDSNRHGYTVIRVWGSHYEMGYGLGVAFAEDIEIGFTEVKDYLGWRYLLLRGMVESLDLAFVSIEEEMNGVLDGVTSVIPQIDMDLLDLKLLLTIGDWGELGACRSHACWGSFVSPPVKSLITRRLDYSTPFDMDKHHMLAAFDPNDGSPRWVNLGPVAYVSVMTAVNEYGTLVSTHNFNSTFDTGANVPRMVATRYVLTEMGDIPLEDHLGWAEQELSAMTISTGTFINYYSPEGYGGVFTCPPGDSCGVARTPQSDYFAGHVLITTNSQTDGHSTPSEGGFMADYYQEGGIKDLEGHFTLMGTSGLHLMSVEYRGREDMTIWAHGEGRDDRIEVEWSELFPEQHQDGGPADGGQPDAGQPDAGQEDAGQEDAGQIDAGQEDAGQIDAGLEDAGPQDAGLEDAGPHDAGQDGGPVSDSGPDPEDESDNGCGCGSAGKPSWLVTLLLMAWLGIFGIWRRRFHIHLN